MRTTSYIADQIKTKTKPMKTPKRDRAKLELHDNAPKRVTTRQAATIETAVKSFHLEPLSKEGNHSGAPRGLRHPQLRAANAKAPPTPDSPIILSRHPHDRRERPQVPHCSQYRRPRNPPFGVANRTSYISLAVRQVPRRHVTESDKRSPNQPISTRTSGLNPQDAVVGST
jgi:hypothetical protein